MNVWKAFEEKNPKLAKWVREGGLFVIVSNLITVLKYLMLQFLPFLFAGMGSQSFGWPGIRSGTWRTCVFYGIYDGNDYRRMYKFSDPEAFCVPKPWEYRKADCMVYGSILCDYVYRQFNQLRLGSGGRIICAGLHLQYWYNRIKRRCFHDCIFLCK